MALSISDWSHASGLGSWYSPLLSLEDHCGTGLEAQVASWRPKLAPLSDEVNALATMVGRWGSSGALTSSPMSLAACLPTAALDPEPSGGGVCCRIGAVELAAHGCVLFWGLYLVSLPHFITLMVVLVEGMLVVSLEASRTVAA